VLTVVVEVNVITARPVPPVAVVALPNIVIVAGHTILGKQRRFVPMVVMVQVIAINVRPIHVNVLEILLKSVQSVLLDING